jgi:Skp family chaperone for outer membrane proteins
MKIRLVLLGSLACVVVFSSGILFGGAKTPDRTFQGEPAIAVVRVVEILQDYARNDKKQLQELLAQQSNARAEMEQRAKEIETEETELKTSKPGSDDYLKQLDRVLEMKGRYGSRKEFLERQMALEQQVWTQKAYAEVVRIVREVAAEKGFRLVLAPDQLEVPASENIARAIAAQKVLYCDGCPDITDEVKARLNLTKP